MEPLSWIPRRRRKWPESAQRFVSMQSFSESTVGVLCRRDRASGMGALFNVMSVTSLTGLKSTELEEALREPDRSF